MSHFFAAVCWTERGTPVLARGASEDETSVALNERRRARMRPSRSSDDERTEYHSMIPEGPAQEDSQSGVDQVGTAGDQERPTREQGQGDPGRRREAEGEDQLLTRALDEGGTNVKASRSRTSARKMRVMTPLLVLAAIRSETLGGG